MPSTAPSLQDILKDMKTKYESPVNKIKRDAKDYGHFYPVKNIQAVPMVGVHTILFKGESTGSTGNIYNVGIQFKDVEYREDQPDKSWTPIKVPDKEEAAGYKLWYYKKPSIVKSPCAVNCTCPDFSYRFEFYLHKQKALIGDWARYTKVPGSTRPPVNPNGALGVCKHLYSMAEILKNSNLISP